MKLFGKSAAQEQPVVGKDGRLAEEIRGSSEKLSRHFLHELSKSGDYRGVHRSSK